MKKTIFAFMALATAFAATSCQSDEELTQQPTSKPMVINAVAEGIGTGTRATMAYKYDILWSESDEIYVKSSTKNATFTLTEGEGTTEGTFACASSPFANGDEVEAFYPATLVQTDGSLVWPAEQTTSTVIPMYSQKTLGSTGAENFSFASLGAVLQIVFNTTAENVTLKSITIKDDNATMSGTFAVDEDGKASITATDKAGITLNLGTGKALGKGANYFNIAVPAGTYSNLSITFTATDNTVCTMKGSVILNHNTVGKLTLTGFTPTAGCATANGIGYVKWVQLWKNGPKFAEFNVGATLATEYGGYYTWGGTYKNGDGITWSDDHNETNEGSGNLSSTDDTATKLWGSNWRMPTSAELQGLIDNCEVEWTTVNSVNGCKFTGKDAYASNSIFLPAAVICLSGVVFGQGDLGYYWSSTPDGSNNAYYLNFLSGDRYVYSSNRDYGYSVRAVLNE